MLKIISIMLSMMMSPVIFAQAIDSSQASQPQTFTLSNQPNNHIAVIPNNGANNFTALDAQSISISNDSKGYRSYAASVNPDPNRHEAYITDTLNDNIVIFDTQTLQTVGWWIDLPQGSSPMGIVFTEDGKTAYTFGSRDNNIYEVDVTSRNKTVVSYPSGCLSPVSGVIHSNKLIFTCVGSNQIAYFDLTTHDISYSTVGKYPWGITVDHKLGVIYVANIVDSSISVIDFSSRQLMHTLSTSTDGFAGTFNSPSAVAINADGDKLYVDGGHEATVFVIENPATVPVLKAKLAIQGIGVAGLGISRDKSALYAVSANSANSANFNPILSISVINTATDQITHTIPLPAGNSTNIIAGDFLANVDAKPYPSNTIGGNVTGLGSGKSLILQNNSGDNLSISDNGNFTFASGVPNDGAYAVTIKTQPEGQVCTVNDGIGLASTNVNTVTVNCPNTGEPVNGNCGLAARTQYISEPNANDFCAQGAAESLMLNDNGSYSWSCPGSEGGISANCTSIPPFAIGGIINGLGCGKSVILQNNGLDDLKVSANGGFTFAKRVVHGSSYDVTVLSQPPEISCRVNSLSSGSGIANDNFTKVEISCSDTDSLKFASGCGVASLALYSTTPKTVDLCAKGNANSPILQDDGSYSWTCFATGSCNLNTQCQSMGKAPQSWLMLKIGSSSTNSYINAGRSALLSVTGGSGSGKVSYGVTSEGNATCRIVTIGRRSYLKTGGKTGSCRVEATKAGDNVYMPASDEQTIAIR